MEFLLYDDFELYNKQKYNYSHKILNKMSTIL